MASGGSGRLISTFVAELRSLNWLRALTRYSVRLRLCLSTTHSTQINGFTFWLSRYVLQAGVRTSNDKQRGATSLSNLDAVPHLTIDPSTCQC